MRIHSCRQRNPFVGHCASFVTRSPIAGRWKKRLSLAPGQSHRFCTGRLETDWEFGSPSCRPAGRGATVCISRLAGAHTSNGQSHLGDQHRHAAAERSAAADSEAVGPISLKSVEPSPVFAHSVRLARSPRITAHSRELENQTPHHGSDANRPAHDQRHTASSPIGP